MAGAEQLCPRRECGDAGRVLSRGVAGMADWKNVRRLIAPALVMMAALPGQAAAQELTAYATASLDGNQTNIQLIGASLRPAGLGLRPVVALQVYRLQYDGGTAGDVTVLSVGPSVGASYRMSGGAVEGRVGYNFQSEDDELEAPIQEGEGGGGGMTTSVQALSWASRPELQGIASYNWGSEYLWSTAQALLPIRELDPGSIAVGGEVVWQGNVGSEDSDYQSWQAGPVLRWSTGRESSVTVGAGYKDTNTRDATWYARIGFVKYGMDLGLL